MKKIFNFVGLVIGFVIIGTVSYVVSGWEDPFVRPMDVLKTSIDLKPNAVQITYPDEITIDKDFANVLVEYKRDINKRKIKKFIEHLEKNREYVITPKNTDVFRAIVVKNEGKGVLSFSVYINVIVDSRPSEVLYRLSGLTEQFPKGPVTVERAEKKTRKKIDVPLDFYYKNNISLWDFTTYAVLEVGPCCK